MIEKQLHQAETKAQRNSPNNNFHNKLSSIFTILSLLDDHNKWSNDSKQDDNINKNQKPEKIDIIILTDTHPDPRTMMIIPLHTMITYSAVNSPDRSVNMTLNTIFLSNTQPRRHYIDIIPIRNQMMIDWRQLMQFLIPLIIIDILR